MIVPRPLFPGARVALVCPSSALPEGRLEPAVNAVKALCLEPVVYPSCIQENRRGYLAASDSQRAADLNAAFADPSIDGILCVRGGYGAHRLLPLLDLELIARRHKLFAGYSDVTALHTVFNQTCRFVTYHTPMPGTVYYKETDRYTMEYLRAALFGSLRGPLPLQPGVVPLAGGTACGPLCGGNLSLLADSLGTPWEIDTRGKLLFLEDVDEKTYRVDAMLTALRNAGKLDDCAGVLLGAWTRCDPEEPDRSLTLEEIFRDLILPAGKPVLMGLPCGHVLPTMSLPMGSTLRMDADNCALEVLS